MTATFDSTFYLAVFEDIVRWDPELEPFLALDYRRIERIIATRGVSFAMIEMPDAAKTFDKAVSFGRLWVEQLPVSFGPVRHGHRKLLRCLFTKVFDDEGFLRDDSDPKAIWFIRQVLLMAKKIQMECSEDAVLAEVEEFRKIDESLYPPSLNWLADDLGIPESRLSFLDNLRSEPDLFSYKDRVRPKLLSLVERVADIVVSAMPALDWRQISPRHGPGAVADAKRGSDKNLFPTWPAKLEAVFPYTYFTQTREDLSLHQDGVKELGIAEAVFQRRNKELPVRLMAVPKTLKGPRMIASEPVSHQFIQLGLMQWFRDNMSQPLRNSIDFKSQEHSRVLCLAASVSGELATVDLSAASDRLSCWVVERFFRSNPSILEALHACRSRWLVNATGLGEVYYLTLRKYAPMGNGTTFPVQSMVYAVLSIASVLFEEGLEPTWLNICLASRRVRTYGDDIILPSSAVQTLVPVLEYFQLKVNQRKSFSEGHFRESCGIDAYRGEDVTPVYLRALELKDTAEALSSWVDVTKNAAQRGLVSLSYWLESKIPAKLLELIPRSQKPLGCLTLWNFHSGVDGGRRRYRQSLHRHEVLALTSQPKMETRKRHSYGDLLQYFLEKPAPDSYWEAGYLIRARTHLRVRWVPIS